MSSRPILLVEDNALDEELTLRAFKKANVVNPIQVVRDGPEALAYLLGGGAFGPFDAARLPAIVLLDLNIPLLDGHEVLRRMRADARTSMVPVVVLTSSAEEEDRDRSYSSGANSYVRKPVDFGRFVTAAAQMGAYWLALNEPPYGRGM